MEEFGETDKEEDIENSYEEEDCDGYPAEVVQLKNGKKKKKVKSTNYGKVASAIGKMASEGVSIGAPNINKSDYTFKPNLDNNTIMYGLNGITKVGEEIVKNIMNERPFNSIEDFLNTVKINKPQMVNLIKSGAFDDFGSSRVEIMQQYIDMISDKKKRITLQNMKMLIDFNLLPSEFAFDCKVYNFNKYLKKFKSGNDYILNDIALNFYEPNFDMDKLFPYEDNFKINQKVWDNIYQSYMNNIRPYLKEHQTELLEQINNKLTSELWNKYCLGSLSKWEMDSVSYYSHEHELAHCDLLSHSCTNFFTLPEEPILDRNIWIKGSQISLYKIFRIAGTVLDKDKGKGLITLLTNNGVVTVKLFGPVFTKYDRQISERGEDGKKHVIEKSWLSRGNKIIVTGIRRGDSFIAKKYAQTPFHLVELIDNIYEDGTVVTKQQRYGEEDE